MRGQCSHFYCQKVSSSRYSTLAELRGFKKEENPLNPDMEESGVKKSYSWLPRCRHIFSLHQRISLSDLIHNEILP